MKTAIKLSGSADRFKVMDEIAFRLHNYVSSAMSLVAHTRRINNRLYKETNSEELKDIKAEIAKRFLKNETHQIIQGLRDYTQHRKLPIVGRAMSYSAYDNKPKLEAAYYLSTESLLEWDGWKSLAKQKLDKLKNLSSQDQSFKNPNNIPINLLITDHYKEVASFYDWLFSRRREWLLKELSDNSKRIRKLESDIDKT